MRQSISPNREKMVQRMSAVAKEGDVVLLVSPDGKRYLIRLKPAEEWHCHKGCIRHDELIGQPLGARCTPSTATPSWRWSLPRTI